MPRNDAEQLNEAQVLNSLPKSLESTHIITENIINQTTQAGTTTLATTEITSTEDDDLYNKIVADIATTTLSVQQLEKFVNEQELVKKTTKQLESQKDQKEVLPNIQETKKPNPIVKVTENTNATRNKIGETFENEEVILIESSVPTTPSSSKSVYPVVVELEDQPVSGLNLSQTEIGENLQPVTPSEDLDQSLSDSTTPKRKRTRRVYTESTTRRATLRSRANPKESTTENAATTTTTLSTVTVTTATTTTTAAGKSVTRLEETEESKSFKITKADSLNPDFWNRIDQIEYEEPKPTNKRKRGNTLGARKRTSKSQTSTPPIAGTVVAELSPATAAAISAAELEIEKAPITTPTKKTRSRNMSLYDRRYQTADDRRGAVSNGYASNTTRNSSAGSGSGAHSDADADISNQYYMSTSTTSAGSTAATSLNGSIALNHAPSMGTLCNIGNTCYLNSVVYTLRFAPHFLHNLHHMIHNLSCMQQTISRQRSAVKSSSLGRGVSGAHLENARSWSSKDLASLEQYSSSSAVTSTAGGSGNGSSGGASSGSIIASNSAYSKSCHESLIEKLHDLFQSLHRNEMADSSEPHHADTLLQALQEVNSTFEGNQQQDAHEFLMCVLNSLRETNQTLIKAIGEYPEIFISGYFAKPDEVDANNVHFRDTGSAASGSSTLNIQNIASTTTSSHSTKASFFSRKSKRKDEVKNAKASRLQSPHKDNTGNNLPLQSNSLFYLNTVDLSGASGTQTHVTTSTTPAAAISSAPTKSISDDETSGVSLVKDKMRVEEKIRELNLDFFSEDFEGVVVLTTKCLSCETVTKQKQGMLDISVPVPISGYDNADFNEKPSAYIQNTCITREYFRGDNKYSCNQCTGYTEAIRSVSYEVLPRLLVIQLNRFSGGMEKINSYVPTTFTLPCFCAKCCELSDGNKLHVYKLYSVITHVGATLSVGHYIAYTCCLDWANEYLNCPRDRRFMSPQQQQQQHADVSTQSHSGSGNSSSNSNISITPVTAAASALASSGTSLMKKMKFGRSKASSSGDMSKNVKQLNGITSKSITNGIGKLSMNTTCHGLNCCAMRLCSGGAAQAQHPANQLAVTATGIGSNSASSSDFSEESLQNGTNQTANLSGYNNNNNNSSGVGGAGVGVVSGSGSNCSYPSGYGSTGRGGSKTSYVNATTNEAIWYMCDDDKIKAMTQREFEELLSPTRKITITPYLLFYARFDLQPTQPTPPKATSTPPQSSWSNESLQTGVTTTAAAALHKI